MESVFNGTFSQVEETVSESFAKNSIDTIKQFNLLKGLLFTGFCIGLGSYALYGVSIYISNIMNQATIPLDESNEFITIFDNIWYMHIQSILILAVVIGAFVYRKKDNIKGFFVYNTFLTMFLLLFMIFFFKVTQLLVYSSSLRLIYTGLFIISYIYIFIRSYQNTKKMVHGTKKKRSALVEWFSRNRKNITSLLIGVGGLYYLSKVIFTEANDLETRIIGSLIDFLPLAVCLVSFSFLYFNSVAIRSYYLYKYSEEFRKKFGFDKKDWYGEKYQG
ncbi:hypothetical protein [Virgibacillus pantothenticus]|uniref:Uncharacterized protein n=1 Tax=Virgibacillus pantothenticus TaxID=1473 RepID=A0A0L0QMX7_VIRPA|nr:hypothetical protein [Virgibacillus pantothenticus]KNE19962.1 hypothetical protein AFK71_16270 [Virgibacillus pantothenticus]MED3736378.1 hypothetical protein [Virgibacillus pantothenticus]QTY18297.1 hypothetical protein KBP50_10945 [Virgibacillus pantothenticus]SIS60443.1 hypothetical protein SAMN05421787_101695 [Virgibacillus pantothenticus]